MLNEGNQIHNFMLWFVRTFVIPLYYGAGSDFLTSYESGSARQKVTVPMVPIPQHC